MHKKTHPRCALNKLAGVVGVEPTSTVLETGILPLNYTPIGFTYLIYHNKNKYAIGIFTINVKN